MTLLKSWNTTCIGTVGVGIFALGIVTVQRLFFHKLRTFPGPRLAAVTSLYKTYYEVYRGGELLEHLSQLHAIYGSVVRIAPNELHFNNYAAHMDIYAVGSHFTKDWTFYRCFGADGSTFGAIDPHDSKIRRSMLSPFFARRAVLRLETVIQEKVDKLIFRLLEHYQSKPANMFLAFRCISLDIIKSYCFPKSIDSLDAEDFRDPFITFTQSAILSIWVVKVFPLAASVVSKLPCLSIDHLASQILAFSNLSRIISAQIDRTLDNSIPKDTTEPTIYLHLLNSQNGNTNRSRRNLIEEIFSLLQAGSEGPGNACTVGAFYVLNNSAIYMKLSQELKDAWPDKNIQIEFSILEKLPYLTAIIKESLRMSHGIVSPLPRIVGPSSANISGYNVPVGTVVGTSVTYLHTDASIFPEPHTFSPERWMQPNSKGLEKYLVPFSRGPRMCLGINLAWCELYLIFGNIFRKLDIDIYDTTTDDFIKFKEFFTPIYQGRNFHALIKEKPN